MFSRIQWKVEPISIEVEWEILKNHMKLLEMEDKISEMKNSPERISSRLDIEEKCSLTLKTQGQKLLKMKHRGRKKYVKGSFSGKDKLYEMKTWIYPKEERVLEIGNICVNIKGSFINSVLSPI